VLAPQGNGHDLDVAIALTVVLIVFRHVIWRVVVGVFAVVALAALVAGAVLLAQAIRL
jgi:hypothetical protein